MRCFLFLFLQKLHYGNFSVYTKSVVYRQQQVYLAQNMFSTAYHGGTGSQFFTSIDDHNAYLEAGNQTKHAKSLFAILAPYSSSLYANPLDITGKYNGNLAALNGTDGNEKHFATADFYKKLWQWSDQIADSPTRTCFDTDEGTNTVCFQGHQSLYNPSAGGMFDIVIKNSGHWGPNVYPGVGKVRNGHQKVVEHVTYNNLYGGGGNLSGMLK